MKLGPPPKTSGDHWAVFFVGAFALTILVVVIGLLVLLVSATGAYSLLWVFGGILTLATAYTIGYIAYRWPVTGPKENQ